MKSNTKPGVGLSICYWSYLLSPILAASGFYQSPEPPPLENVSGIAPVHHHGHWNSQQILCIIHCSCFSYNPGGHWGNME
jgi:hypothetical protein